MGSWIDRFLDLHPLCHGDSGPDAWKIAVQGRNATIGPPARVLSDTGGVPNSDGAAQTMKRTSEPWVG